MLKAKELQAPIERLLHALHRREPTLIAELAATFSKEAQRCRIAQTKKGAASTATDYEFGAWEVLEAIAIRANARQKQNARVSVARRRYALDLMQTLARSPKDAVSPGALARELSSQHQSGIHVNNVSRLIAKLKEVGLVEPHERSSGDARTKPVQITDSGLNILGVLRPDWRTFDQAERQKKNPMRALFYTHPESQEQVEPMRKVYVRWNDQLSEEQAGWPLMGRVSTNQARIRTGYRAARTKVFARVKYQQQSTFKQLREARTVSKGVKYGRLLIDQTSKYET